MAAPVTIRNISGIDTSRKFHVDWHVKVSLRESKNKNDALGFESVDLGHNK